MDKPVKKDMGHTNKALRRSGAALRRVFMNGLLVLGYLSTMHMVYAQDDLAKLPDPTRPWKSDVVTPVLKTHKDEAPPTLKLESTIVSGDRRLAIIDGNTVGVGEFIKGFRVKQILHYSVLLEKSDRTLTLKLVDEPLVKPVQSRGVSP